MRTVQVYIEGQKLDLFKDEEINVTSTIQNISDISKVFTDFSQSFTVPASKTNNTIFKHYYQNDLTTGFVAKERKDANIEINLVPFRRGKMQLEGSEVKDNKPESYRITFYGDVVTLKDLFGEDKLSDLDYTSIATAYDGANVQAAQTTTTNLDVRYPLVSSSRVWVNTGAGSEDISTSGGAIAYTELFPAIRTAKILEFIEAEYGITFVGTFKSSDKFGKLYTWWKNRDITDFTNKPEDVLFDIGGSTFPVYDSKVRIEHYDEADVGLAAGYEFQQNQHYVYLYLVPSVTATYIIDVFKDGVFHSSVSRSGVAGVGDGMALNQTLINQGNSPTNLSYDLTFTVRSYAAGTYTGTIKHRFAWIATNGTTTLFDPAVDTFTNIELLTLSNDLDFNFTAPDMKIADYFSGLLKMFNLTCYPLATAGEFQLEPLDVWYAGGGKVDITQYVDVDSIKYDRPKLYKEISFEYSPCKSFLNVDFKGAYVRDYGSLKSEFPYDGDKFEIKLPFEQPLFYKFDTTNLQVGYALDKTSGGKTYVPKVTNFYLNESKAVSFYFNNGATTDLLSSYVPFGQDLRLNSEDYSSNFGLDQSTLLDYAVSNSLYQTYYEPYLLNLYNDKTRLVTLKAILPIQMLYTLSLDDAVIVRGKQYRINTMKTNLSSGVVDLELISDWIVTRGTTEAPAELGNAATTIVIPIKPIKPNNPTSPVGGGGGTFKVFAPLETSFITGTPALPTVPTSRETELSFQLAANTTGLYRTNTIKIEYYEPDGTLFYTEYIVINQLPEQSFLLAEDGSYLLTESLDRILIE